MDEHGLAAWSAAQNYAKTTTQTRLSDLRKLEKTYGDLDALYGKDELAGVLDELRYSTADRDAGLKPKTAVPLWGDSYRDLAHLRATVNFYRRFRTGTGRSVGQAVPDRDAIESAISECLDLGALEFAARYAVDWPQVRSYLLQGNTALPSRGLYAAACQYMTPATLSEDVSVTEDEAQAHLKTLGFILEERPAILLFGHDGRRFAPVMQTNRETGAVAFTYRPEGANNRRDEAVEVSSAIEIARALFIDGRPVRIAPVGLSPANYLTYPGSKFAGHWLRPDIEAALGMSASSAINSPSPTPASETVLPMAPSPTNLILFGPPGTGKTWTTAQEAVALCDGSAPSDRAELMDRYRALVAAKRISFVTFHQSMDYEAFVEGLRPETDASDSGEVGFRLEPRPGIFREVCALAAAAKSRPKAGEDGDLELSQRSFWKMSLGAAGVEDDVYEAALEGGYIVLGWGGDIDWSPARFDDSKAIRTEWESAPRENDAQSNYSQLAPFRNDLKIGDIVIVPYGNRSFRAVGEVTGDYAYAPNGSGDYSHRRSVRWLLRLDEPLPLETIIDGKFTMRSFYSINRSRINLPALAQLIGGEPDSAPNSNPDQFVLIIDEINRANVSKVFGELITLIEPDKRQGQANAIEVTLPHSSKPFGVPDNLHLIGTMNTADRSIALLDTALRRRFQFREMPPKPDALKDAEAATGLPLVAALAAINDRIEFLLDRDHRIGHAFLVNCRSKTDVEAAFRDKIIPLLQEYFFEDWSKVAAVLNEDWTSAASSREGRFLSWRRLSDPTGSGAPARTSWEVRRNFEDDAYRALVSPARGTPELFELEDAAPLTAGTE